MKSRSPEFSSQCRVLNFPWTERRTRRSNKSDRKMTNEQMEYSRILTFQSPSVEFTPASNDLTFPLIQMMNGKEPVVWEEESRTIQENCEESSVMKNRMVGSQPCLSQTSSVNKSVSKNRIPRPKNAFILYRSHVSQLLKETMAFKVRESNISSLVSEMWKKESDVVHTYYAKRAALEWVKYMKRLQQDRSSQNVEGLDVRPSTPPALSQSALPSLSPEFQPNTVSYSRPAFSSPMSAPSSISSEEKSAITPYSDPFLGTMLYGLSSSDTNMRPANTETSTLLSSPQSSNDDFSDSAYKISGQLDVSPYSAPEMNSMTYPFKDSTFSVPYDMNQLDMGYNYALTNPSMPVFSTSSYPYVVNTGLSLDTGIRLPGMISAPTMWPVNMI
ncbi:hypothetical protein PCANB_000848 [Pneumocystis canis]|nr:hypothetical protein PCANB_000848 [Pneumocystis canis]